MHTYRHSGAFTLHGILLVAAAGFATACLSAFVYTFGIAYIPWIYISALLTIGFGCLIGWVVGSMAKLGKIRNNLLIVSFAIIFALVGIYCSWGVAPIALMGPEVGIAGFHPQAMVQLITYLYENGSWGLSENSNVKGLPLAGIWLTEIAIILASSLLVARHLVSHQPFCEPCEQWTETLQEVQLLAAPGDESLWDKVKAGDLDAMNQLALADSETNPVVRLNLATCPTCSDSNFLTIEQVEFSVDKYNNVKEKAKPIIRNVILDQKQVDWVGNLSTPTGPETEASPAASTAAVASITPEESPGGFTSVDQPLQGA